MSHSPSLESSDEFVQIPDPDPDSEQPATDSDSKKTASNSDSEAQASPASGMSPKPAPAESHVPAPALDDEDIPDESLSERIAALAEMFPSWLRTGVMKTASSSIAGAKTVYSYSRSICWIVSSTAAVFVMPVLFEVERSSFEEQQKMQQRQILLGPGAGPSPSPLLGPPPPIPAAPPLRS